MNHQSRFYSPAKFDSDQKDVLISQLKAEIFELRQNDRDFSELSAHLKNLEHRYQILSDEKMRSEQEFRNRNEQNMKTIANLRTDIDTLKSNVTEKHIETQELRAENLAIKEIADHRALDISRLKNELSHQNELNTRGQQERIQLEGEIQSLRDDRRKALEENDFLQAQNDTLSLKGKEQDRFIRELEYEKQSLEKHNQQLKVTGEQLEFELRQKNEQVKNQQASLQDNIQSMSKLQEDIEQLEELAEKYKQESQQFQKQANHESNKNFELGTQLLNLETTIKARDGLIDELKKEIDDLKQAHVDALDQNEQSQHEISVLKRQFENLQLQNQDLVGELEAFNDQDEQIRQILNRKTRVKELRLKNDTTIRNSISAITRASPTKSRMNSKF